MALDPREEETAGSSDEKSRTRVLVEIPRTSLTRIILSGSTLSDHVPDHYVEELILCCKEAPGGPTAATSEGRAAGEGSDAQAAPKPLDADQELNDRAQATNT